MTIAFSADPILQALDGYEGPIIIDTETSALQPFKNKKILAGLAISTLDGERFYMPVRHRDHVANAAIEAAMENPESFSLSMLQAEATRIEASMNAPLDELERVFEHLRKRERILHNPIVMHNAKFDMAVLLQDGLDLSNHSVLDTMVIVRLISEDEISYALKNLGEKYVDRSAKTDMHEIQGWLRKHKRHSYDFIPVELLAPYAETDLYLTAGLYKYFYPQILKRDLGHLLQLEVETTRHLFDMERRGVKVDIPYVQEQLSLIGFEIDELSKEAFQYNGGEAFNMLSAPSIKKVFHAAGIHSQLFTAKGAESWSRQALALIDHPLTKILERYRLYSKIRSSYYENFLELVDEDGVLHCSFFQAGARTGRLSCREPNLQNIPRFEGFTGSTGGAIAIQMERRRKREERMAAINKGTIAFDAEMESEEMMVDEVSGAVVGKVRGAFVPRPGHFFLFADWQQMELRIFADYAGESELIRTFELGLDIHRLTALTAFGSLPADEKSQEFKWVRNMGKQIAFGLLYGMGKRTLAIQIERDEDEAGLFMENYFARFKRARLFIEMVVQTVIERGWIKDRWGRRRYLPRNRAYVGVNFLIQGTAADMMKEALVKVANALLPHKARILMTIHDELVVEVPYEEAETVIPLVVEGMTTPSRVKSKMRVDVEWTPTRWSEKKKLECDICEGRGIVVGMPQDILLRALFNADEEVLRSVETSECEACNGQGWSAKNIKTYLAEKELVHA